MIGGDLILYDLCNVVPKDVENLVHLARLNLQQCTPLFGGEIRLTFSLLSSAMVPEFVGIG